jgi:acyl carrier protein
MKRFDREDFTRDLIRILSRIGSVAPEEIALTDDLRDDIGLDSLQSMELLSRISEQWDVDVEMEDMIDVKTVGDVVEFMSRLAAEQAD